MNAAQFQLGAIRAQASQALPGALRAPGTPSVAGALDINARARAQAVDFEAVFLSNMFSEMFTGTDGEGPLGGGGATGMWRSFLTDEYGKSFARAGGIGIADHVYRALLSQQEARAPTPVPTQDGRS